MSNLSMLLVAICIILAATRLVGGIFQKLHQPRIIGEMIAGILLGPSLLGWLAPDAMTRLFPPHNLGYLNALSQVGLLLYMFIIGLKLDTKFLSKRKHAAIVISHSSIICPFLLGFLLALYLHPRLSSSSVPPTTFALFMGIAMSITAFPVLARILSERRLLHTKIGSLTIACAAVDDVTAWLMLTAITIYAQASNAPVHIWPTLLILALYFCVMLFVIRPGLRKLQNYLNGRGGLMLSVLVIILLLPASALTTEWLGIHALFGAFFAGSIMPENERLRRFLSEKIEPAVVALLLPIFFALTGLRTSIRLVSGMEMWFYCALILVVAVCGKLGGSMLAARLTGIQWREAGAIGVLMNTRGLVELVILNIGFELGLIPVTLFSMMVLMALVTTFMTSPLLALIYPSQSSVRDVDIRGLPQTVLDTR